MNQAMDRQLHPQHGSAVGKVTAAPRALDREPWQHLTEVWNFCTDMHDRWAQVAESVTPEMISTLLEAAAVVRQAGQKDLAGRMTAYALRLAELFDIEFADEYEVHSMPNELWIG